MNYNEAEISLNAHELGILLSSLKNLSLSEEMLIARDYGSASALYDKLYESFSQLDHSKLELRYDFTPSF